MFSCEFCEISKNALSYRTPPVAASEMWCAGARKRKKRAFFVPFILLEGNSFKIFVLPQCILYWIHFQNMHTFTYQKTLLHTLFLLVSKIFESLNASIWRCPSTEHASESEHAHKFFCVRDSKIPRKHYSHDLGNLKMVSLTYLHVRINPDLDLRQKLHKL